MIEVRMSHDQVTNVYYACKQCSQPKTFVLAFARVETKKLTEYVDVIKVGEHPAYDLRVPSRLLTVLRPHHETFLKGKRAEAQGLGIGAFAYYRRIVELAKNALLDEIVNAAKRVGATAPQLEKLEAARNEHRFSASLEAMRGTLPASLFVGDNLISLLHEALSVGVHEESDEECLARAATVRTVLVALIQRTNEILRENTELKVAVETMRERTKLAGSAEP